MYLKCQVVSELGRQGRGDALRSPGMDGSAKSSAAGQYIDQERVNH